MKTTQTHIDTDTHKRAQPLPEPLSAEAYQAERISPTLRLLDLAPFEAAYEGLCALMMLLLDRGAHRQFFAASRQINKTVTAYIKASEFNGRVERKLDMLACAAWRSRVLAELGGRGAIERWERIMRRRLKLKADLKKQVQKWLKPHASPAQRAARAANLAKARAALFRKQVQQGGLLGQGGRGRSFDIANPGVLVDRVKVDQSGQFRLAPLERIVPLERIIDVSRAPQKSSEGFPASFSHGVKKRPKVYYSQLNPIAVWPAEFRAAQRLEPAEDWAEDWEDEENDGDVQSLPPPRASAFDWASISGRVRPRAGTDVGSGRRGLPDIYVPPD